MESGYAEIAGMLNHPRYRQFFQRLVAQEREHKDSVDRVLRLFSES